MLTGAHSIIYSQLGVYQPRHARPAMTEVATARKATARGGRKGKTGKAKRKARARSR